ncbi:HAMP domain-containing histidine kinase, partial [Candidatus Saccharibacteria bacterium]|nr:HAMP domain-containing histidine kinase [Candidatus Saccharibacteria bacterium]
REENNLLIKSSLTTLKAPLAQLKAKLQTNLPSNPQVAKPALEAIAQLEGLLNKFTILSSLESGSLRKLSQSVDLNQLVSEITGHYAHVLQSKALTVKADIGRHQLNQDRLLLSFAVDSLLSNAIKYSPQGGQIIISSHKGRHGIEISVHDSGPGIDEAKQAELFQPFSRAENAAENFNRPGAGLSLYLDKLVMHYLGGQVGVDSKSGHGTSVSLVVPA